jgi:hypothetical protein
MKILNKNEGRPLKGSFSWIVHSRCLLVVLACLKPALADPLDLVVLNSTRIVAPTSIELYQGTITNNTGAGLMASDLFFNFSGFDPQFVSFMQLLGIPDFTISSGATSPIVDLFDFTLGPNAPPGTYSADVVLQDFRGNTSNIVTITEQVAVPEPPTQSLLAIGALLCLLLPSKLRAITTSRGFGEMDARSGGVEKTT